MPSSRYSVRQPAQNSGPKLQESINRFVLALAFGDEYQSPYGDRPKINYHGNDLRNEIPDCPIWIVDDTVSGRSTKHDKNEAGEVL